MPISIRSINENLSFFCKIDFLFLDKPWVDCQFHDLECLVIKKPDEIENEMKDPPKNYDEEIFNRIEGSMFGMALGDALGAHVEFRPRDYLRDKPVEDLQGGGTWGLQKGQVRLFHYFIGIELRRNVSIF
jgi:hypothetical protein